MPEPITLTGHADFLDYEDSRQAAILSLDLDDSVSERPDPCLFVRIQSWDRACEHTELHKLFGKRLKITIEVVD